MLDVFRQIAARHALVDMLMTGQIAKLIDPRFDIVSGDSLPGHDGIEVHLVFDPLVGGDRFGGHGNSHIGLGLHDRDPEFAFADHLALRGPDAAHGFGGIAFGEDVGD